VPRSQAELITTVLSNNNTAEGVKYVLRPTSEWGKVGPDNSKYTPNYEDNSGPPPPPVKDGGVNAAALKALFGG